MADALQTVAVLDTGALLLLTVGRVDTGLIARFRRTRMLRLDDFDDVAALVMSVDRIVTTPYVLAETSAFAGQLYGASLLEVRAMLAAMLHAGLVETPAAAQRISESTAYPHLGLTDAALLELASPSHVLATVDHELANQFCAVGGQCRVYPLTDH